MMLLKDRLLSNKINEKKNNFYEQIKLTDEMEQTCLVQLIKELSRRDLMKNHYAIKESDERSNRGPS